MKVVKSSTYYELQEIARLRYEVYYEELAKVHFTGYDHEARTLINQKDYLDTDLLYVHQHDNVIGTLRCVYSNLTSAISEKYDIKFIGKEIKYAEVDLFIIRKPYRNSRASLLLASSIYERGLMNGTHICLIEVEQHLYKFYRRMGFVLLRQVGYSYGIRYQMSLNLWDQDNLQKQNSPFERILKSFLSKINKNNHEKHHQPIG